jgi:hypothetical protein
MPQNINPGYRQAVGIFLADLRQDHKPGKRSLHPAKPQIALDFLYL